MTVDKLVRRRVVAVLAPAFGQHILFVRLQHRELPDLPKVTGEAGFGRYAPVSGRQPTHDPPTRISFETKLSASNPIVNLISKRYYSPKRCPCQHEKRQSFCCRWDDLCKPRAMTVNSVPPNGWRSATSPALIRSPGTHRLSPSFKQPPVAPHRKPSRHSRQGGTWSASDPRWTGEASACD